MAEGNDKMAGIGDNEENSVWKNSQYDRHRKTLVKWHRLLVLNLLNQWGEALNFVTSFCFQNESDSETTSTSGENNKDQSDRSKRFDFLLKQTEIFSHFMTNSTKSPTKPKGRAAKKPKDKNAEATE